MDSVSRVAHLTTSISKTTRFWAAFVLTRTFGSTMGDLLTKSPVDGGLGFGTIGSSAALLVALAMVVTPSTRRAGSVAAYR